MGPGKHFEKNGGLVILVEHLAERLVGGTAVLNHRLKFLRRGILNNKYQGFVRGILGVEQQGLFLRVHLVEILGEYQIFDILDPPRVESSFTQEDALHEFRARENQVNLRHIRSVRNHAGHFRHRFLE